MLHAYAYSSQFFWTLPQSPAQFLQKYIQQNWCKMMQADASKHWLLEGGCQELQSRGQAHQSLYMFRKVQTSIEDWVICIKLLPKFPSGLIFNIEILYLIIVHRVLWKGNSRKSGKGVTYIKRVKNHKYFWTKFVELISVRLFSYWSSTFVCAEEENRLVDDVITTTSSLSLSLPLSLSLTFFRSLFHT